MKKNLLLLLLLAGLFVQGQSYNNEWIDYSKTYYKFKVGADGLYRINQSVLTTAGLGSVPAEHFQLWRNGQQVPLYTSVQTGVFGVSDYIEFWGEMNDGKPDLPLYRIPDHQLNDKWSLETDTSFYFLTANPSGANLRLVPTTNNLPTALTPEPYFIHTVGKYYKDKYHFGYAAVVGEYVYSSNYENGEGFTSPNLAANTTRTETFSNLFPSADPGAPSPFLKINATGDALNPRQFEVRVNGNLVATQTMDYFDYVKANIPINITDINTGAASLAVKNISPAASDRMVIAKSELVYARQFNFGGANNFSFDLPANAAGNYLEITGFNYGTLPPILYDLTNGKRYVADIINAPAIRVVLEPSASSRKLLLVTQDAAYPKQVTSLQQRNFINYALPANQGNYLIITHPALLNGTGGSTPVEDYKAYRNSAAGGSHNAKIYMIDQLVDQFGFGIKQHPLSVRNFIRWARNTYSLPVKNVFIIGKGLIYIHNRFYEANPDLDKLSFVPTFGYPGSDILLAADQGLNVIPQVPIGRLSVIKADEITIYLKKVKEYEQQLITPSPLIRDKAWMKNVVHVIGAGNGPLGDALTASMNRFADIIKDTFYGANVHTFSKLTTAPVEQANAAKLYNLFEEGIGVMTYFGHSSATTLEFNLDNPDSYNNRGKYPLFILLGCNAGNFFFFNLARLSTTETISEKFVLANQKGSIATFASTHLGIVHYLDIYNSKAMSAASVNRYGSTLGEIMKESIIQVFNLTTQNDYYARFHCEQTTLHGDPAIKLDASAMKPDYAIEEPLVKINPSFISVAENQFTVQAKFLNLGKAVNDNIIIELKRTYPNQTTEIIRRDTISGTRFADSLTYFVPIQANRDKGLNKLTISIDVDNNVDELFETNNTITKDIFIYEDEVRPIFPYDFAIVRTQSIKLKASTANPFSLSRQYVMEIDTTSLFNSSLKVSRTITSTGGVIEFDPGITYVDNTVYYWRVSPVPVSGVPVWNQASFIFLSGNDGGFNQSHFYQHLESESNRVRLNPYNRVWEYDSVPHFLFAKNGVFLTATTQEGDLIVSPDGSPYIRSACVGFSLIFNIFNPQTFKPVPNPNQQYGSGPYCAPSRLWNFEYSYMTPATRKLAMDFMDSIPQGYIVVVRNILNNGQPNNFIDAWQADTTLFGSGNSLYHKLRILGFSSLDSFTSPKAMIFMYQKGNSGFTPISTVSQGVYDLVTLNKNFKTPDSIGFVTSPLYGPSKGWKRLKWDGRSDIGNSDTATVDIVGVRNDGTEDLLFSGLTTSQQDFDVSSISANDFPYLKLRLSTKDAVNFTPYQLNYWRITYDPVPEGAIAPNIYFSARDTVEVGENFNYKVAFKNVSEVSFDSLKIRMVLTDRNNIPTIIPMPRRRLLPVEDTLQIGAFISTSQISGLNSLYIEANPDNDQPEQYHFNNFAYRDFYVKPDSLSPLLDVTFDGVHILNRDIVSSKPDILIKLKDEAKWMILDDTSLVNVQVRYPSGVLKRFYFSNDTLRFTPAGQAPNTDNTASANLKPYFTEDGTYELIVTGKDRSSNEAGSIEYRVLFEVINKPMISNMLNYPNPFTTSTAFVFTITGNEVPQNIKIEIMTVTGKIVREITKDELGPLHIGRNITEFKWDGTDQYGQKLANGVYLYRVVTNLNGKSLDKYKSDGDNTDKYFNKGYGKMYLMR